MKKATKMTMFEKELDEIFEHKPKPRGNEKDYLKLARRVAKILEEEGKFDTPEYKKGLPQ